MLKVTALLTIASMLLNEMAAMDDHHGQVNN
jgi:hypothetical protein